jgi:hypothetical protein
MKSYPASPSVPPRNALLGAAPHGPKPAERRPVNMPGLLASAIGHAAALSDTPSKWDSTIAMLKQHGVDPAGFEDFKQGRPAAMTAAGLAAPQDQTD